MLSEKIYQQEIKNIKELSMVKWSENVYIMNGQSETDRPCMGYIKGKEKSILIDAGTSPKHVEQIRKNLQSFGLKDPDMILLTHSHWDHTYGLAAWEAVSYAEEKTVKILQTMKDWEWSIEEFEEHIRTNEIPLFCKQHILLAYPDLKDIKIKVPDHTLTEEMELELGGITVRCIPLCSPHSDDGAVYYIPEEKLLFLGDSYNPEVIGEDWYDRPEIRKKYIEQLEKLDYRWCVTGHHGVLTREAFLEQYSIPLV